MSLELNKVLIVGRLTKVPETRMTNTGKTVAKLSIAINRRGWGGGSFGRYEICPLELNHAGENNQISLAPQGR